MCIRDSPNTDPLGAGYNTIQAKVAIGSGGLFGKGYLQGNQTQLQYIPEQWTDFIYCVIGEEMCIRDSLSSLIDSTINAFFSSINFTSNIFLLFFQFALLTSIYSAAIALMGMIFYPKRKMF